MKKNPDNLSPMNVAALATGVVVAGGMAAAAAIALHNGGEKAISNDRAQETVEKYARIIDDIKPTKQEAAQTRKRHSLDPVQSVPGDALATVTRVPAANHTGEYVLTVMRDASKGNKRQITGVTVAINGSKNGDNYDASIMTGFRHGAHQGTRGESPWIVSADYPGPTSVSGSVVAPLSTGLSKIEGFSAPLTTDRFTVLTADMGRLLHDAATRAPIDLPMPPESLVEANLVQNYPKG